MADGLRETVQRALAEDIGRGDVTSQTTVPAEARARGRFVAREELVVAGLEAAGAVFDQVGAGDVRFAPRACDGDLIPADGVLAGVSGSARSLLAGERVALNLLMRLSGVATLTRRYVTAVEGTDARVTDTRKTTPGLRALEKAAVHAGGGTNHRFGLDDGILIKDNHLALAGGVGEAVQRARAGAPHLLKVEVEVESLSALEEALEARADVVLLDNMPPEEVREAVALVRQGRAHGPAPTGTEVLVEVSGGVDLSTVRAYAEAGADLISVGALTHSARAVDISLDLDMEGGAP